MNNKKYKLLYSKTENGIQTSVRCVYNSKTDHITITSGFSKNNHKNNGNQKSKSLYSKSDNSITTQITCVYNLNTDHITISSRFIKNKNSNNRIQTNPNCSSYLGVYIAERVLSKVFKNVERMPYGNPGYDFICDKGYKIDVKSTCHTKSRCKKYTFSIKRNKITDYFLFLAFDNRQDLNPLHLWLIPGHIVNNKITIEISESTLDKWSEYEQPINKVISCCDTLRSDKE